MRDHAEVLGKKEINRNLLQTRETGFCQNTCNYKSMCKNTEK